MECVQFDMNGMLFVSCKSSQVKWPLIKTSDNRTSFTSTMNENKIVTNQYTVK